MIDTRIRREDNRVACNIPETPLADQFAFWGLLSFFLFSVSLPKAMNSILFLIDMEANIDLSKRKNLYNMPKQLKAE